MAEYGQPQRSATSDANDGVVNQPTLRRVARTTTVSRIKTQDPTSVMVENLTSAVQGVVGVRLKEERLAEKTTKASQAKQRQDNVDFGDGQTSKQEPITDNGLGKALTAMIPNKTTNIKEEKLIVQKGGEGIRDAINSVDKVKKRVGWEKFIFGQNTDYRVAQQRAVENKISLTGLERQSEVANFAGHTSKEYYETLRVNNNAVLTNYDDDPETKALVASALADQTRTLMKVHHEEHYAYNQEQQRKTSYDKQKSSLDQLTMDRDSLITPEEVSTYRTEILDWFKESLEEGQTKESWRNIKMEVLLDSMKAGNAGGLLSAQAAGWDKTLSSEEQADWDKGVSKYDGIYKSRMTLVRTQARSDLAKATTFAQIDAIGDKFQTEIDHLAKQSSGTLAASQTIASGNLYKTLDIETARGSVRARNKAFVSAKKAIDKEQNAKVKEQDTRVLGLAGIADQQLEQALAVIGEGNTPETNESRELAYQTYAGIMAELQGQLSPSIASLLKFEKLKTAGVEAQAHLLDEQAKFVEEQNKKKAEVAEQQQKDEALAVSFETDDVTVVAANQFQYDFNKAELEQGLDTYLYKITQDFNGGEIPNTREFAQLLLDDPLLQEEVAKILEENPAITSPVLQSIIGKTTNHTDGLFDEDGNVTEEGTKRVALIRALTTGPTGIKMLGGAEADSRWSVISDAIEAGTTQTNVADLVSRFNNNRSLKDISGFSWKTVAHGAGVNNKMEYIEQELYNAGFKNPSQQSVIDYMASFERDLRVGGWDVNHAKHQLKRYVQSNKIHAFGSEIYDASMLNDATTYSFENWVRVAEKYNWMNSQYFKIDKNASSRTELPDLKFYTKPGHSGFFMSSPTNGVEVFVSTQQMKSVAQDIEDLKNLTKEDNLARRRAIRTQQAITDAWEATGTQQ